MSVSATDDALHGTLAGWFARHGGAVHRNLALRTPYSTGGAGGPNQFSRRGIFAAGPIEQGEVLVRLPRRLALDGSRMPSSYAISGRVGAKEVKGASGEPTGLDGSQLPSSNENDMSEAKWASGDGGQRRNASPWLRCMAALMHQTCQSNQESKERNDDAIRFDPYVASLPEEYDSLLNWSAQEVRSFLAGTTLGAMALQDGTENPGANDERESGLRERFRRTVVPYLTFLQRNGLFNGMGQDGKAAPNAMEACEPVNPKRQKMEPTPDDIGQSEKTLGEERMYLLFREGCMCISTRAFHMQSPPVGDMKMDDVQSDDSYNGPYLLPYIDLLNHAPKGSSKNVTTLQRDPDGSFVMIAERDIAKGDEICHSYESGAASDNESLNSSQLLQTFGFVDMSEAVPRLLDYYERNDGQRSDEDVAAKLGNLTPAVLTKDEISRACKQLAGSDYPKRLRQIMDQTGMLDEGWECWDMPALEEQCGMRLELSASLSEEFAIPFGAPLSDEVITLCSLHFLPDGALNELLGESDAKADSGSAPSLLLGSEVLEDFFMGKLVLQAITCAIQEKLNTYQSSLDEMLAGQKGQEQSQRFLEVLRGVYHKDGNESFCWGEREVEDVHALSKSTSSNGSICSDTLQKWMYGMTVSLEERTCLQELKKKIAKLQALLDGEL